MQQDSPGSDHLQLLSWKWWSWIGWQGYQIFLKSSFVAKVTEQVAELFKGQLAKRHSWLWLRPELERLQMRKIRPSWLCTPPIRLIVRFKKIAKYQAFCTCAALPPKKEDEWALSSTAFEKAVQEDVSNGLIPCMLQINVGTTSTCAVDSIEQLAQVCKKYDMWSHVDAAYAGSAAICPTIREQYFQGLDDVDSFNFNPHKWLFTNFDCSALWVGDSRSLVNALSITPEYLRSKGNNMDLKDWQVPLGRRFRSLKLWFVLRLFGTEKLQQKIQRDIALADWFASQIQKDPLFELVAPQRFGLVCFRVRDQSNEFNQQLLNKLNESGKICMVHTVLDGVYTLRFAVGGTFTQFRHVQAAWGLIRETANSVLSSEEIKGVGMN
eukprot:TRINITY_DN2083_c0_g2_i8.p1 TRINITY_DN2083_c0_g2~~TRINITY_DN2083_c0_g2_i8.p1  ORF type:complete len:381 (-),score=30.54 TRINITY_DN2083_c0_g2_i8:206-1348(-)